MTSPNGLRLSILLVAALAIGFGASARLQTSGAVQGKVALDMPGGDKVRVGVDASLGRSDEEQWAHELTEGALAGDKLVIERSRQAMVAMGVEGAEDMSDEEIRRHLAQSQMDALHAFAQAGGSSPEDGLYPIE